MHSQLALIPGTYIANSLTGLTIPEVFAANTLIHNTGRVHSQFTHIPGALAGNSLTHHTGRTNGYVANSLTRHSRQLVFEALQLVFEVFRSQRRKSAYPSLLAYCLSISLFLSLALSLSLSRSLSHTFSLLLSSSREVLGNGHARCLISTRLVLDGKKESFERKKKLFVICGKIDSILFPFL